ncbi:MAG TPA: glycosyltransferase family 4 protein [Rhizomicrobium sp.]|nr:glycosyltransferase family 4 protein [Rhizomicrobium sp.]
MTAANGKACLLITNIFPPAIGGSSQVYAALAAAAKGGIVVLTSSHDHETGLERAGWRKHDHRADYPIHRLTCVRPFLRQAIGGPALLYRLHEVAAAIKLMAKTALLAKRYHVHAICIADDETVGWLVALAKYLLGRRTLIYCHGDDLQCAPRALPRRSHWLRTADGVVAANRYAASLLAGRFDVPEGKILLVQNGVDLAAFRPGPPPSELVQRFGLAGRRVLLSVTRLVPRKGVDKVIAALPDIAKRFPQTVYLVVGDGPQAADLRGLAQKFGVADQVIFAGSVPHGDVQYFYNAADIVLLPNRAEEGEADGLPLVFLEANACGKPVIGGRAGGTAEIVRDADNGVLVDGHNSAEISRAICDLLGDEARRQGMGQAGLRRAQDWGWDARTQLFLDFCRR